jgi:hypothetical protein
MATSNLSRLSQERYRVAISKYDTPRHDEALQQLQDLLMDAQLPMLYRLRANIALSHANDDWYLAEAYREDAESVYSAIREMCPIGDTRWPGQERSLVDLRKVLDTLAEDQLADKPEDVKGSELTESPSAAQEKELVNTRESSDTLGEDQLTNQP